MLRALSIVSIWVFYCSSTNRVAVVIFYLLYIVGILAFVVVPGLGDDSLKTIYLRAALFGLITYATYDLTNLATVKN